jgi:hypothetical protein
MAQHDYNIVNAAGSAVRTDLNSAFSAIATNNSGATTPATTYALMWWFDTAGLLKMRDAADANWVTVASLSGTTWTPYLAGAAITSMATQPVSAVAVDLTMAAKSFIGASSSIASATTVNLAAAAGNSATITGTTTVTAFGTVQSGGIYVLTFAGALTLTHNATSLILPGAANIQTAAGDIAVVKSEGSGNWRCVSFTRAVGVAHIGIPQTTKDASAILARGDGGTKWYHTSATPHAWTIPPNSSVAFPIGTTLLMRNIGSGAVTITRGSGVALSAVGSATNENKTLTQYGSVAITKEATDSWTLAGTL